MAPQNIRLSKTIIIDGHNLIPNVAGLSLEDPDDEERLIKRLIAFARQRNKDIDVFFDRAAQGQAGIQKRGLVRAHFVQEDMIADEAIRRHVTQLGKQAKNVTVVSSDHRVQAEVRALGAQVIDSDVFAEEMARAASEQQSAQEDSPAAGDVDVWLDIFKIDPQQAEKPIDLGKKPAAKKKPEQKKPPSHKARPHHGFPQK